MIRVLVADDHQLVRAGIRRLLEAEPDITVVAEAGNGAEAIESSVVNSPDVVLMDLSMPDVDGVEGTRGVRARCPGARVLVLSIFSDRPRVTEVLAAGATGYVLKDSEPADLVAAVRTVAGGLAPIDPRVAAALLPASARAGRVGSALSPRETDVLRLVAQGLANKEIARALGISERTVKAHLGRVFREIGVLDRTSAALWAGEHLRGA